MSFVETFSTGCYVFAHIYIHGFNISGYLPPILLLFLFVFCLFAGERSAKITGKIRTGTIAGLWTSFIMDIGLLLGSFVLNSVSHTLYYVHGLDLIVLILFGLLAGALGGAAGIRRAK